MDRGRKGFARDRPRKTVPTVLKLFAEEIEGEIIRKEQVDIAFFQVMVEILSL